MPRNANSKITMSNSSFDEAFVVTRTTLKHLSPTFVCIVLNALGMPCLNRFYFLVI